ncbi:MAG: hypothetical protein Q8R25_04235 [bacterium]|nr:hypothetical protein [bacterium]
MKMTNRTLGISLILFTAIATGAFALQNTVAVVERNDGVARELYQNALTQHRETVGVIEKLANKASTLEDWKDVLARAATLPESAKAHYTLRVHIGMLESLAGERDRLFVNAGELYTANEKDPDVRELLDKAKKVHELADATIQQIAQKSDVPDWSLSLHYRKAYEKYRSLAFLEAKEVDKALDIIDDALSNLRRANTFDPKNNRVELAIEFLYKKAKEEERKRASGDSNTLGRPRALPPRGAQDNSPGTGGAHRPRLH